MSSHTNEGGLCTPHHILAPCTSQMHKPIPSCLLLADQVAYQEFDCLDYRVDVLEFFHVDLKRRGHKLGGGLPIRPERCG